jgi:(2Fe-2S) ferredoxin
MYPDKVWYSHVKKDDADRIVDEHLKKGEPITALTGKVDKGLKEIIFQLLDSGIF